MSCVKSSGSTRSLHRKLSGLSVGEVSGIPGVAVKCVDIRRNTCGESGSLDHN
jgi:hypothetical protein